MDLAYILYSIYIYIPETHLRHGLYSLIVLTSLVSVPGMCLIYAFFTLLSDYKPTIIKSVIFSKTELGEMDITHLIL